MSKNIHGEEINEKLFNKKASEKLNEINNILSDIDDGFPENELLKIISEYGMIMYHYGAYMHGDKNETTHEN